MDADLRGRRRPRLETQQVKIWRGDVRSFEMPCGGTIPTGTTTPQTFEEAQSLALVDRSAPESTIARRKMLVSRRRIVMGGGSTDTAPEGLQPRVARVLITIGRRVGKRCRFLNDQGRFGPRGSCARTPSTLARVRRPAGTVRWTYSIGAALPKGRYVAWARGIDAAGNVEGKVPSRNRVRFRIR